LLYYGENSKAIDIWSVGCVLAEFLQRGKRHPLFPGKDFKSQLLLIVKTLGTPPKEDVKASDSARKFMNGLPIIPKKNWKTKFPNANPSVFELLDGFLHFNPEKRMNVEEALKHPYFEEIFDEEEIISAEKCYSDDIQFDEDDEEGLKSLF
jgi:mitogen-activated protein kinase 1/3